VLWDNTADRFFICQINKRFMFFTKQLAITQRTMFQQSVGVFGTINVSINVGNLLAKVTNYSFEFMSSFSIKFMSKEHANNSKTLTLILEAYYCRGIEWVQRGFVSLNLFVKNKFHLYSTLIVTRTLTRRAPKLLILPTLPISFLFSLPKTSWNLHLSRPALTSEQCSFFLQFLVHSKVPYNN
jgi:hypothetical protein